MRIETLRRNHVPAVPELMLPVTRDEGAEPWELKLGEPSRDFPELMVSLQFRYPTEGERDSGLGDAELQLFDHINKTLRALIGEDGGLVFWRKMPTALSFDGGVTRIEEFRHGIFVDAIFAAGAPLQ